MLLAASPTAELRLHCVVTAFGAGQHGCVARHQYSFCELRMLHLSVRTVNALTPFGEQRMMSKAWHG